MTVAELIEALKALPPDLRVGYSRPFGWFEVERYETGVLRAYVPGSVMRWFEESDPAAAKVIELV